MTLASRSLVFERDSLCEMFDRAPSVPVWFVFASLALGLCANCAGPVPAADANDDATARFDGDAAGPVDADAEDGALDSGPPRLDPEIITAVAHPDANRVLSDIQSLVGFGTRNSCSSQTDPVRGIGAARAWIRAQFAAIPGVMVTVDTYDHLSCLAATQSANVVAWIPGTEPNRLVIIGGHYDSIAGIGPDAIDPTLMAPGANDSGSQTAVVLEAARALAGRSYRATLVFVSFSGEEQRLQGSAHLARNIGMYFPGATVEAMLNCDIVGGDNVSNTGALLQQFRLYSPGTPRETGGTVGQDPERQGTPDDTSPARGIMRYIAEWTSRYVPAMTMLPRLREDRPGRGGDHESFLSQGYAGVRFVEPVENLAHQHSPEDIVAYVTPAYTARIAQVVVATAGSLARAPAAPRMFVAVGRAMDTISLRWTSPASGNPDHYVVAARPTTGNFYVARVVVAGSETSIDLPAERLGVGSAEAFFVSVAAADAAGHESLFAYPEYRCDATDCTIQLGSEIITGTRNLGP